MKLSSVSRTYYILFGIFLAIMAVQQISAQNEPDNYPPFSITVSYCGETATHPGLVVGMEYGLIETNWYRLSIAAQIGGYYHHRNHTGLFIETILSNRATTAFGLYGEIGVGVGYLHTWSAGDVYARQAGGGIALVENTGRAHVKLTGDIRSGFDFSKNQILPGGVFMGLALFGEYPFNGFMLPHAALQTGLFLEL